MYYYIVKIAKGGDQASPEEEFFSPLDNDLLSSQTMPREKEGFTSEISPSCIFIIDSAAVHFGVGELAGQLCCAVIVKWVGKVFRVHPLQSFSYRFVELSASLDKSGRIDGTLLLVSGIGMETPLTN